jgi:hypothetical protein
MKEVKKELSYEYYETKAEEYAFIRGAEFGYYEGYNAAIKLLELLGGYDMACQLLVERKP